MSETKLVRRFESWPDLDDYKQQAEHYYDHQQSVFAGASGQSRVSELEKMLLVVGVHKANVMTKEITVRVLRFETPTDEWVVGGDNPINSVIAVMIAEHHIDLTTEQVLYGLAYFIKEADENKKSILSKTPGGQHGPGPGTTDDRGATAPVGG